MGFVEEYFINPITMHTGYNIVNTLAYAAVFIVFIFLTMKIFKRMKIELDNKLWIELMPFVILAGALRALNDIKFFGDYYFLFLTPLIYFIIFALALSSIIISRYFWKDFIRYFGWLLASASIVIIFINGKNWIGFITAILLSAFVFSLIYLVLKKIRPSLAKSENSHVMLAHIIDASASFTAISIVGGFVPEAVVTSAIYSASSLLFIPIKLALIVFIIYLIDRESQDRWSWVLRFSLFAIGFGPGLHNLFSLLIA